MNYVLKTVLTVLILSLGVTGAAADKKKSKTKTKPKPHAHAHVKAKVKAKAKAVPAKVLFGKMTTAAFVPAKAYGSYAKGCFAGGKKLSDDALNWQVMRPSRNRNWGHPRILAYINQLAKDAKAYDGWPGLLVGDMSQPRGGPVPGMPVINWGWMPTSGCFPPLKSAIVWLSAKKSVPFLCSPRTKSKSTPKPGGPSISNYYAGWCLIKVSTGFSLTR